MRVDEAAIIGEDCKTEGGGKPESTIMKHECHNQHPVINKKNKEINK